MIDIIKRKMLVKYPFFGSVVTNVDYKENTEISTAGTDGKTIYYNPNFLEKLSIDEQVFAFAHEVCHIAFNHVLRSKGKDSRIWNVATDAVINAFLRKDGLKMIDGCVDIKDAINYDAEELYEKLKKEQPHSIFEDEPYSKDQQSKQDVGHDTHGLWETAIKKQIEDQGQEESKIKNIQEQAQNLGEKETFNKNVSEKKRQLKELRESIVKEASKVGTSTNKELRNINNIGNFRPLIDWRYLLREAINCDVDWSYKHAYLEDGIVKVNIEEQPTPETEIVLDTSGSIDEELLKSFLRECKNVFLQSRVKVGCFDTEFYGFQDIRDEKDIENMKFIGGGGTNFDVAVGAFSKRVENKIIFTDGEACMPKMTIDVIWVVFGNIKINPPGGRVIYIDKESLKRLSFNCNHNNGTKK